MKVSSHDENEKIILGSANLTKNALDNNREILIDIGKDTKIYNTIFSLYNKFDKLIS